MTTLVSILANVLIAAGWMPFTVAQPHEAFAVADNTRQCVNVDAPDGLSVGRTLCTDGGTFGAWDR